MSEVRTTTYIINQIGNVAFISKLKSKNNDEAFSDEYCIFLLQEELDQFKINQVSELAFKPKGHSIIGPIDLSQQTWWTQRICSKRSSIGYTRLQPRRMYRLWWDLCPNI